MVKPYSDDLRERVALFVLSGETVRHAAEVFRVSVASAVNDLSPVSSSSFG
jgi:transposase